MKKSTEPSRGEMNKASTTEVKLSSKTEYVEKLRKDNEVHLSKYVCIIHTYVSQQKFISVIQLVPI